MSINKNRPDKKTHEGRNIKRFREIIGMKQEALAIEMREGWHQKRISLLEAKETIDPKTLMQVAQAFKVSVEAIRNFDEEDIMAYFNSKGRSPNDSKTYNHLIIVYISYQGDTKA